MGFDLFGPAKTSDIKVGYISTDRGYVQGVTICEANSYAKLNPGTTFILKNRKSIEYKNINEVNNLRPVDAFVPAPNDGAPSNECGGINLEKEYGPPKAEFYGGGGVGVKGNVVVGDDGGVLGVHLVSGGNGYQYPPIVKIKDGGDGKKGGGVVAIAGLGQTAIVKEVYDAEEEFEEYFPPEIKNSCDALSKKNNVGFGRRYSPDGKDLGPWDPSIYVNTEEDPIRRQIAQFQEYLAALTDPWWSVRKEAPLKVTSDNEEGVAARQKKLSINPNRTVYPVKHADWGGIKVGPGQSDITRSFMNDYAVSPVPMSSKPGSDFAGMLFTMEWEEKFPFPGEYTFKAQCDNEASFYLDGQQLMPKIAYFTDKPTLVKKNLEGKVHKMRIDLLNAPQYKDLILQEPPAPETSTSSNTTAKFEGTTKDDLFLVVSGSGTATAEIKLDVNDSWSSAGLAIREMKCGSITLTRTKGKKRETLSGSGTFPVGRHKVEIIGAAKKAGQPRVADTRIELLDDHGSDTNAALTLKVKSVKSRPQPPAKPKPVTSGIKVQKVFNTVEWMGKANRQLWRTNVYGRGGFVNTAGICPFDTTQELDTNPYAGTHEIKWRNIYFPIDGNYIIKVAVDDSVNLRFHGPGGDIIIRKEGFINGESSLPTGTSTYTRFFKKGNYTLDADLEQIPGGRFGFRQDKGKTVKDKEVSFKVTSAATYANKITIPGLFSVGKDYKGSQLNENFIKNVQVDKEYDVVCTSEQSSNVRIRIRDNGRRLEMEEYKDGDWQDIVCTVTEGKFYSVQGNRCKFKLEETIKGINPMVLAIDVEVAYATKTVVSARSWQENPMGVAFTVKAPLPPVPVEESPKQEGRCPNNPMWTTRFPSDTQWFPVRMDKETAKKFGHKSGWSEFLNRWAVSPILPLNTPGTAEGGKVFTNTWKINVPYDGYYQLKGEVDDIGKYYIDDDLKLDLTRRKNRIRGTSKFFLTEGLKTLRIEVENYSFITYKNISKKIFSARDWKRAPLPPPVPAARGILCHAGGGKGGTDNSEQLVGGKVIVGKGGAGGPGGDDNMYGKHHGGRGGGAGLRNGGHSTNSLSHTQIDAMGSGKYKGGPGGFGVNFQGTQVGSIEQTVSKDSTDSYSSGGDGVAMGGGGGGAVRKDSRGRGGHGGDGGVQITWGLTSKSQQWTTPGVYNVTVPGTEGKTGVTIVCIGGGGSGFKDPDGDRQGSGGSGGAYSYVNSDIEVGQKLKIVVGKGGQGKNVKGGENGGDSYVEVVSAPPQPNTSKIIKQQKGTVSYSGPHLFQYTDKRWGKVMNKFGVSPSNVEPDLGKPSTDNIGTKVLEWKNVDFSLKGRYDVLFVADNKATLYINGEKLLYVDENFKLSSDKSYQKINIGTPGRYDVKIELVNSPTENKGGDVFNNNPAGVVLEIRKDVSVAVDKGKSWTQNPVGVAGVLVPPPCPKEVGGKGVVTKVQINDPGTGFEDPGPGPDDPQYPVVAIIKKVRPVNPGINYDCSKDKIIMEPDLGYKFTPVCDNFGRIKEVITEGDTPVPFVPQIEVVSLTGLACILAPEFEFVVPPPTIELEGIIQVTDLAGIKQTGYYNGKPYYGAIYYENGIKYAGWYATAGQPIQIYDTLQESIDATIITPPSAIQRQGSDVTSNDPRLNIPGTPENFT